MHNRVWVIDDDRSIRWVLTRALEQEGYNIDAFSNADDALNRLESGTAPAAIITDIRMPGTDGLKALKWVHQRFPSLPVIVMTAHSDLDAAVDSYRQGAFDYLPKPFDIDEVKSLVKSAIALAQTETADAIDEAVQVPDIIGASPAMQEVFRAIGRLSQSSATVLINGASGSGKERVARALHRHSVRSDKPFVALNMAAIPRELVESELFGHERGAFTGANTQRAGRFEQANGGTLFLDEIGDMPLDVQTRLLRVLQEHEFFRIGGSSSIKVDVRIIAATHQQLDQLVEAKQFRQDLFYRLNVIRLHLPDLAQRRQDIAQLADHFLAESAHEMAVERKYLAAETVQLFEDLPWPGNVRQLENLCRWLTVMVPGSDIYPADLPDEVQPHQAQMPQAQETVDWQQALSCWASQQIEAGEKGVLSTALPLFEKALIDVALEKTAGNRQQAAKLLGWGRNTLARKLNESDKP